MLAETLAQEANTKHILLIFKVHNSRIIAIIAIIATKAIIASSYNLGERI